MSENCCNFAGKSMINRNASKRKIGIMENKETKTQETKRMSKFWEACQKYKGAFVINDPKYAL